jgi:hypothetical protein
MSRGPHGFVSPLLAASDGHVYLTTVASFSFGRLGFRYDAYLNRVNPTAGTFDVVTFLGNYPGVTSPVQGSDGTIYIGVGLTATPDVLQIDPANGSRRSACAVGSSSIQHLSASPDGALHGVAVLVVAARYFRCDPGTRSIHVRTMPDRIGLLTAPFVLLYGSTGGGTRGGGVIVRFAATAGLPPLDSEADGLPGSWETA